jgi:SAM-dependent methyltransferase
VSQGSLIRSPRRQRERKPRGATPPLSLHAWLRFSVIRDLLPCLDATTLLEIGVGQGSLGVFLASRFDYTGIELDHESLSTARRRFARLGVDPARLLLGGLEQVAGRRFDLVCAFEVLEHFEDDLATLVEWRDFVSKGGSLLLSVPAGPHRFAAADEKAGHFRRYSRRDVEELLSSAGFADVRVLNYGVPVGYALEHVRNVLARQHLRVPRSYDERTCASGRWLQPPEWSARLTQAVAYPFCRLQRPFTGRDAGTGIVALGTLRDDDAKTSELARI